MQKNRQITSIQIECSFENIMDVFYCSNELLYVFFNVNLGHCAALCYLPK